MRTSQKAAKPDGVARGDIALWCLAGVMAVALYLAPQKTSLWTCASLVCMAALAAHPTLYLPWVRNATDRKAKASRSIVAMSGMMVLIVLYGWTVWPPVPYYRNLTQKEKEQFMEILKSQKEPREQLKLTCPSNDEGLCVIATGYLELFQRAGWSTPTGGIERGLYGKSVSGISIAKKPEPGTADPNNPNLGLWVPQTVSIVTIIKAFDSLNLKVNRIAEQDLPENMISIYFGPQPTH
jgi:hypothetical protein